MGLISRSRLQSSSSAQVCATLGFNKVKTILQGIEQLEVVGVWNGESCDGSLLLMLPHSDVGPHIVQQVRQSNGQAHVGLRHCLELQLQQW